MRLQSAWRLAAVGLTGATGWACVAESAVVPVASEADSIQFSVSFDSTILDPNFQALMMEPGDSVALSVTLTNALGYPVPVTSVSWFSDNPPIADVNDEGLVWALSPGTATIFAVESENGLSAGVPVEVVSDTTEEALPPLPPPEPGSMVYGPGPNHPSGLIPFFSANASSTDLNTHGDFFTAETPAWERNVSIVADEDFEQQRALKFTIQPDESGFFALTANNNWTTYRPSTNLYPGWNGEELGLLSELYLYWEFKIPSDYIQNSTGTTKFFYYKGGSQTAVAFYAQFRDGAGGGPSKLRWRDQSQNGDDGVFEAPRTDFSVTWGEVHTLEIYHVANSSPGVADGSVRVWLDGVEVPSWSWLGQGPGFDLSAPAFNWIGSPSTHSKFNGIQYGPYYGGTGSPAAATSVLYGGLYLAGRR